MAEQTPTPPRSLFDLPPDFFDSGLLLHAPVVASPPPPDLDRDDVGARAAAAAATVRWTCNTCGVEFESLVDQRSHFKSDLHRLNVKLHLKGKNTIKEEDFDDLGNNSLFKDSDISSISGSEDELENDTTTTVPAKETKHRLYIKLQTGETFFVWSCVLLDDSESISFERSPSSKEGFLGVSEKVLVNRLKHLLVEPRDKSCLRIVLLVRGGHFAGCVFDGNDVIAHKTFHRYIVRAKSGKKQSSKDATGRAAHSAGSSLRRYNEAALKKEIQELLVSWKSYFASSVCILVHAPSKNSQLLFDGESPVLTQQKYDIRHVPLTVRRPTFKEVKRIYNQLTQVTLLPNEDICQHGPEKPLLSAKGEENGCEEQKKHMIQTAELEEYSHGAISESPDISFSSSRNGEMVGSSVRVDEAMPLHDAVKSGNAQLTLELLEKGLDPTRKDFRGRTAYVLAKEKEVRNVFRRFMASNPDKWDWHDAGVPSALTKEMEDSQAAKQIKYLHHSSPTFEPYLLQLISTEKDAKRKAKAKELKQLRKAKQKAQAQAASASAMPGKSPASDKPVGTGAGTHIEGKHISNSGLVLSKEEQQKRALDIEREKRAAAAERRFAALKALPISQATEPSSQGSSSGARNTTTSGCSDTICSCCNASLAGKVPFHRYNYKYCSTSCMHVHREMLEDG